MDSVPSPVGTATFSLLETMRLEDGRVPRLERHLERMQIAARRFGYPWAEPAVRGAVETTARSHASGSWRLRLLLSREGVPSVECTRYERSSGPWRVAFAAHPVADTRDPFVLNKTTHRAVYDAARSSHPDVDDVLLWNSGGEVTEATIGNVVAEIDGVRYTPPVSCGLLSGTFRAEQLEAGTIRERVLTKADVAAATRLWLINSVREWIDAELVRL
jgi:para-aminobenzoate synthetase/4-amino-4-deoxychorismate lyase